MKAVTTSRQDLYESLVWFAITAAIYWVASHHLPIVQKQYVYLAEAFLKGSLSITNPPDGVVEIFNYNGGNYVGYGVMPGLVLLPFVAIWGRNFDPAIVGILMGAASVLLANRIFRTLDLPESARRWLTALFAFGTVNFHASIWGTSWFLMQVVSIFFMLWAIYLLISSNRVVLVGLLFGASVLSRNAVLIALPFFLIMISQRERPLKHLVMFGVALSVPLLASAEYNFLRFGNPLENGYELIATGPFGLFSYHYLRSNIQTYFFKLPEWLGQFPYLRPSLEGMSLLLITPAFILLPRTVPMIGRDRLVLASWVAVAAVGGLYLMYFWAGFAQFGVRYTLDFTAFLMLLAAANCRNGIGNLNKVLIALSIAVNIWGIAWWRFYYLASEL